MRAQGICGATRAKKRFTTKADVSHPRAPDLVKRDFTASRPDALWVARHGPFSPTSASSGGGRGLLWPAAPHRLANSRPPSPKPIGLRTASVKMERVASVDHLPTPAEIEAWPDFTVDDPMRLLTSACLLGVPCGVDGSSYGAPFPHVQQLLRLSNIRIVSFCARRPRLRDPQGDARHPRRDRLGRPRRKGAGAERLGPRLDRTDG